MAIFRHLTYNSFYGKQILKYVRRAQIKSFLIKITRKRWADNKTTTVNGSQSPDQNSLLPPYVRLLWITWKYDEPYSIRSIFRKITTKVVFRSNSTKILIFWKLKKCFVQFFAVRWRVFTEDHFEKCYITITDILPCWSEK